MIPHAFLQDLLACVDVVDVVGRFVQLKKSGANFIGLCPFHHEKTPSFTVSPSKQFYHCFGCSAHGSAIGFLMEHSGLGFVEAVNELAQSVGLTVPREPSGRKAAAPAALAQQAAPGLVEIMQRASDYYREQLRAAPAAIAYLKHRGLSGEIAKRFGLGYAPHGWQHLAQIFPDQPYDALVEAGLMIEREPNEANGPPRRYDRFRDRIMFPIRNLRAQVMGFGARVIERGEPKYLNSPETPLFNKSRELYGLFEARAAIREHGYALVVEGYLDALALAQMGFPNTVATLGTACTSLHVQKLLRHTDHIVFGFDGDEAGRRAARRALEACLPHAGDHRTVRFLFLPSEHDPDSYIRARGAAAFAQAVKAALPLSQFLLNEILDSQTPDHPEGRAKALFHAKPLLQVLPANVLRAQIVRQLAQRLELPVAEITALLDDTRLSARRATHIPVSGARRRVTANEQRALRTLIAWPRIAARLNADEIQILTRATRNGAVFEEVLTHARALGNTAHFSLMSDVLKHSPNAHIYEEALKELLALDEMVRDLQRNDAVHPDAAEHSLAQENLALEEVRAAITQLHYNALRARCDALTRQPTRTPEENAELAQLLRQTTEFKKRPGTGQYT
ncbi:DNA primase [Candidatus Glomeribacter gigasporarum BEG34]|uniref:DNA primase n=1 Tax=Candidatus Glomeribacter gigasporarum BEG34 TaxID=1070319 RepID=G2J7Q2_9BURK|nr:DNA primase [Candidatus Glomeribacter gigasporarum]CCD28797.1 DNA primase [Candidatus Glomeribacter gigasporarum BEG34]